jgi:hypothetical protein
MSVPGPEAPTLKVDWKMATRRLIRERVWDLVMRLLGKVASTWRGVSSRARELEESGGF